MFALSSPNVSLFFLIRDQNGNAARVAYHGLGIAGDRQRDSSETISQHINCILTEKSFRIQLEKMSKHLQQYQQNKILLNSVHDLWKIS